MLLKKIKLINFKNYQSLSVDFHKKLNVITGLNGSGKTNLLDAIYYLCSCKSYFQASDKVLINFEQPFFTLEGAFEKNEKEYLLSCKYSPHRKKTFECNRNIYEKLAEHIGQFPVSFITPDDIQIVKAGSEFRRKLTDHTLSQINQLYLRDLIKYNKILQQRNAYLKQAAKTNFIDEQLLLSYDNQLEQFSKVIFELRKEIMPESKQLLEQSYKTIANGQEAIGIQYKSNLKEGNLLDLLKLNRAKDRILKRTNVGIHKDDWEFLLGEHSIKKLGSQGQQKSFLIALKLAYYHLLKNKIGEQPLLLLDDIFDKLDANRIKALLKIVTNDDYGQVFITDADNDRLPTILNELNLPFNHYLVENNELNVL